MEGDGTTQFIPLNKFVPTVSGILQQKRWDHHFETSSNWQTELIRFEFSSLRQLDTNQQPKIWSCEPSRL